MSAHNGQLTAHIVAAPFQQVMQEFSHISGAQVVWLSHPDERPISVAFSALPFPEALQHIVRGHNFLLVYTSAANNAYLKQIWLSTSTQRQVRVAPPASISSDVPTNMNPGNLTLSSAVENEEDQVQMENALQIAMQAQDSVTRLEAIEMLAPYATVDPRIRTTLSHLAQSAQDSQVQEAAAAALAEE